MIQSRSFAILLCLAAACCSFEYRVDARLHGGKLVFETKRGGLLSPRRCVESFELITANPTGARPPYRIAWRVAAPPGSGACARYPIAYGVTPAGMRQTHAPERLRPGAVYEVQAGGPADGFGSFRIFSVNGRTAIASEG